MHEWVAILDFGSQYTQLIARRIRSFRVYCEILPHNVSAADLSERRVKGIILSGGPASVRERGAPDCDPGLWQLGIPILGICYGMQLMARNLGGRVEAGTAREYGMATIRVLEESALFRGLPSVLPVWMSHGDRVSVLPPGYRRLAETEGCPIAAMVDSTGHRYGLQFHPEVAHTPSGCNILQRFVFDVCGCKGDWEMAGHIEEKIAQIRRQVGEGHVICGLSGGVDSAVTATLVHRAVGSQLHCVFVDNGLLREREVEEVMETFGRQRGIDLRVAHAATRFLEALRGVSNPEEKRKIIGRVFVEVFVEEARKLGDVRFLAQGTLYPDVVESMSAFGGPSVTIKSHHNVGGLPPDLGFELVEPLRELFKDEVREMARLLGLPSSVVNRQPFPGPGLAVRVIGEVTPERLAMLRQADRRLQEEIARWPGVRDIWQSFAVLLPVQTVGVMGDERTYENVVAIRVVQSVDGMTADWVRLPYEVLDRVARRIVNEVRGVNRVVYDITSKPPGTIEWE